MIYFDNAASTAVHPEVVKEMIPYFDIQYGNPSSIHQFGRKAKNAIQKARKQVAALIGAEPDEILFTSGGTESNNTILYGIPKSQGPKFVLNHIITSSIEHEAILEPCRDLEKNGVKVTYLSVDEHGIVNPNDITNSINPQTVIVSVMFANNEVGTIQPIKEISKICNKYQIPLHTDAVQAVGKVPIDVKELGVDALSISSHKINGPKGVGALFIKKGVSIKPMIFGGSQERNMRAGTENVSGVAGLGLAAEIANQSINENFSHLLDLENHFKTRITEMYNDIIFNGLDENHLPGLISLTIPNISSELLLIHLDNAGIAISNGSACSSGTISPSPVLKALGISDKLNLETIRVSAGRHNTINEVNKLVESIDSSIISIRKNAS